jgi:hypothetical protein
MWHFYPFISKLFIKQYVIFNLSVQNTLIFLFFHVHSENDLNFQIR